MWTWVTILLAAAPLSFDQAVSLAEQAPDLFAFSQAQRAHSELSAHASRVPSNPQLTIQPTWRDEAGNAGPGAQISLSQSLNLAGFGNARRAALEADRAALAEEASVAVTARRLRVASAWLDLWTADQLVAALGEEEQAAAALVTKLERALAVGAVTKAELEQAKAAEADAELKKLSWEGRQFDARSELGRALGAADEILAISPSLPRLEPAPLREDEPVDALPSVRERVAAAKAAEARDVELLASRGAQVQLNAGGASEWPNVLLGFVGASFTLPWLDHAEAERAPYRIHQLRAEGEAEQARREARATLRAWIHEQAHTAEVLRAVEGSLVPATSNALAAELVLFERGEVTLQELLLVRQAAVNARVQLAEARAAFTFACFRAREWERLLRKP